MNRNARELGVRSLSPACPDSEPTGVAADIVEGAQPVHVPSRAIRIALSAVAWFNLLSAVAGMVILTIGDGLGMPLEWLEGTPFTSFFWPGIILGVVVGGVQALALVGQYGGFHLAWGLHAAAGLVMMVWIFVEIAILLVWSPLQGIYFATGFIQTVLAILALGAWPRPFFLKRAGKLMQGAQSSGPR